MAIHKAPASNSKIAQKAAAQADAQNRQRVNLRGIAQVKKLMLKTNVVPGKSATIVAPTKKK